MAADPLLPAVLEDPAVERAGPATDPEVRASLRWPKTLRFRAHAWFVRQRLATFFREHRARLARGEIKQGGW